MKALVTGIAGLAGSHLSDLLISEGIETFGIELNGISRERLALLNPAVHMHLIDPDIPAQLHEIIIHEKPDWIFHLAGLSNVAHSWNARERTLKANFFGAFHLLEGVRTAQYNPRLLIVGSGEEYGLVPESLQPIREEQPLWPRSPYAVSKVCQEMLCLQYVATDAMDIVLIRPFNHIGPRQHTSFVTADFARQVALIEAGKAEPLLRVGNLNAQRDFTHVRDMVYGYYLAMRSCPAATPLNISSGIPVSIKHILDKLLSFARIPITVEIDPSRFRPADIPMIIGDSSKFRALTGWKPSLSLDDALLEILEYWREQVLMSQA